MPRPFSITSLEQRTIAAALDNRFRFSFTVQHMPVMLMLIMYGTLAQIGKFGIVGVLNTLIDFGIFNFLVGRLRFAKITANICSTTVAMIFSFVANREAVFHAGSGNPLMQAVLFFVVTGFGLYVLQSGVFYVMLHRWHWPLRLATWIVRTMHLPRRVTIDFVHRNGIKVCGTIISLVWNFILYKYVVFR